MVIRRPPGQRNQLFRMTQSGALLNPPINTPAPGPAGALDAKVSPDGRLVPYWFVTAVNDPICVFCIQSARRVARLRVAGRCDLVGKGQATRCRFKTIEARR